MIKSSLFLIKVRIIHSFYIDLNYLIHFSFLIVIRGIKYKSNQYLGIVKKAIDGDYSKMFPTTITSIIGNSLLLSYIVNNPDYYQILNLIGMIEYKKNNSLSMKVFYSHGEFLQKVMIVSNVTKEVMNIRYPGVFEKKYDAIQLRMGGSLADYHIQQRWLSKESLRNAVKCIDDHFKSKDVYIASDSKIAKEYMKNQLKNRNVIYVNEETLYSDTQVMNIDSVVIATYTAVADLYILGNSQTCLMTGESTFAYTGCAISGRIPYIIHMKNECVRMK